MKKTSGKSPRHHRLAAAVYSLVTACYAYEFMTTEHGIYAVIALAYALLCTTAFVGRAH